MSKCLVLFVEGDIEVEFYKQVIANARKLRPNGMFDTNIECKSINGVGGFKNIVLRKFVKEIKTKYDEDSERDFVDGLVQLIDSYDDRGQGFEMFLPLVGTGMSRANIQHQEALQKIKATFELHRSKIKGTVNIVIYSKDSDKVSIFD